MQWLSINLTALGMHILLSSLHIFAVERAGELIDMSPLQSRLEQFVCLAIIDLLMCGVYLDSFILLVASRFESPEVFTSCVRVRLCLFQPVKLRSLL